MVSAYQKFLVPLCNAWNIYPPKVNFIINPSIVLGNNILVFVIYDNTDIAEALAYHMDPDGQIAGYVFAKTILDEGGVVLYKDSTTPTVSSALFHEIAETLLNRNCNGWWYDGYETYYAMEICDPVQNTIIPFDIMNGKRRITVGMSDYILPSWGDFMPPQNAKFNYLNTLTQPFTLSEGGYAIVFNSSGEIHFLGNQKNAMKKNNHFSRLTYLNKKKLLKINI